jgi:hypothetical protein
MGHQDPKDKIFRRWYQSRHFTAAIDDIYKGREPRSNKKEALSMHLRRDADAPPRLPKDLEKQLHATDEKIQELLESRKSLKQDLDQTKESNNRLEEDRIKAALDKIRRDVSARKATVSRHKFKAFRAEWFEARPGEIFRSQEQLVEPVVPTSIPKAFRPDRRAVIEAMYPEEGQVACSRLEALERLVEYCDNNFGNLKPPPPKKEGQGQGGEGEGPASVRCQKRPYYSQLQQQKEESGTKKQKTDDSKQGRHWTKAETEILEQNSVRLDNPSSLSDKEWLEIFTLLPGRTKRGIILSSYKLRKKKEGGRARCWGWTEPETRILEEHFLSLSHPSTMSEEDWQRILTLLPRRTRDGILKKFLKHRKAKFLPKAHESQSEAAGFGSEACDNTIAEDIPLSDSLSDFSFGHLDEVQARVTPLNTLATTGREVPPDLGPLNLSPPRAQVHIS